MSAEASKKSALWADLIRQIDANLQISGRSPQEILHYVTGAGFYTFAQLVGGPQYEVIVADYLAWLDENGTPIQSMPGNVRESALVHPTLVECRDGRAISTMFLFHLCIARRLAKYLPAKPRILEIGGGYGGLARVARLLWPDCQYTIVDIEDSLRFSRLFLGENFPETLSLAPGNELTWPGESGFFEFIPAHMLESIEGREFDIVLNTCSFGEMTQSAVDTYHDLIENRINVPLWYSINRFGRRPYGDLECQAPREAGEDTACMTMFPSSAWDPLVWDCWNETGFAEIEICAAPYLEILLTRIHGPSRHDGGVASESTRRFQYEGLPNLDAEQRQEKAAWLLHEARNLTPNTSAWHYAYFNALRYYPTRSVLDQYRGVIEATNWPEAEFFATLAVHSENLPEVDFTTPPSAPVRKLLFQNLEFTRLTRTYSYRIIQRFQQLRAEEEKHNAAIATLLDRDRHILEITGALDHVEALRSNELTARRELEQEIDRLKARVNQPVSQK